MIADPPLTEVDTTAGDLTPVDFYQPDNYCPEESIGYLMKRIMSLVSQAVECDRDNDGPTFQQWLPLYMIYVSQARNAAELARECTQDAGSMTRLLDRLEAKGMCQRVRSVDDRRVIHVELTELGREAAQKIPHVLSRVHNQHLAGFSYEEWQTLKSFLRRILANGLALAQSRESAHGK